MPASSVVYDATLGSLTLKQVRSASYNGGATTTLDYTSGGVSPSATYLVQAAPTVQFTSGDLDGVMDGFTSGAYLGVASGTITIPWNLRSVGSTFASGTAHDKINATDGLFAVQSYSASQGDAAGASVTIAGNLHKPDGTIPVTISTGQSLSAAAYNCTHKLGPATINGSAIAGITRVSVNPGVSIDAEFVDGGVYPIAHYVTRLAPTIEVTGRYQSLFTSLGPIFTTMTAAVFYFRKRAEGGTTVSDGTGAHLSFTFADGIVAVETVSGSDNAAGEVTLRLHGEALTMSSTATIS